MIRSFIKTNWALLSVAAGGFILRLWHLTSISLWHDEAFSALLIKYSWGEMMYRIGLDVHPPMYYIFLRFWHYIFGDSLFALRGMSVLFGVATIIATYYFVNYVFNNRRAALIAALLVAVNPFQAQYVTEARMYTMGAFFAIAGALALVAALRTKKAWYYFWFVLCSAIMLYTHYYLIFMVAALGLYGLWHTFRENKFAVKKYWQIVLSGILIGASFLPWLKIFLFQLRQVGAGYWIPPMDLWSIPRTLWELLIKIAEPSKLLMVLTTLLTLWIIIRVIRKYQQPEKWLILGSFAAPFLGAILFLIAAKIQGENSSVYLVRYFIFCSSFYLILVALFLNSIVVRQLVILFSAILIALNLFAIGYYWQQLDVVNKPGMAAAAKFLQANVESTQKIFVGSSFEFFNYKYYNQTSVRPLLYTDNHHVHDLPHFAGTAILAEEDLVLNFQSATTKDDTVWLLWTNGFGGSKPQVPANWTQIDEKGFAEVRPYVGTWVIVTEYKVN